MGALPPTVIVANKIDLRPGADASKVVTTEEGEAFTKYFIDKLEVPAVFIETSAKTGENIQDTFTYLLKMMSLAEQDDELGIFQGDPGI
jgi:GTPase SAR1 family protein